MEARLRGKLNPFHGGNTGSNPVRSLYDALAREEMGMLKFVQDALDRSWIVQCESRERAIGAVNANLQE